MCPHPPILLETEETQISTCQKKLFETPFTGTFSQSCLACQLKLNEASFQVALNNTEVLQTFCL